MFKFFKKKSLDNKELDNMTILSKTASLFIHAAKIDESYTQKEKEIIKKALIELGANEAGIEKLMLNAEINEKNSIQILDFTKEIKNVDENFKIKIIETLWGIIYSNKEADMYEASLMRRLSGLLYLDNKIVGDIKEKMRKKFI
jgi:uncharacterized tellurite resistance protein B-like protein